MSNATAEYRTKNPTWPAILKIRLINNDAGYWWTADGAGNESMDATINAQAAKPGSDRKTGYATRASAIRAAIKAGWTVAE